MWLQQGRKLQNVSTYTMILQYIRDENRARQYHVTGKNRTSPLPVHARVGHMSGNYSWQQEGA